MNKIAKAGIGIAAVAAVAATGALVAFAWGPSRTTYTLEKPATKVTFNSITNNNKEVGDERYFVSASPYTGDASKNHWTDNTQVENGKEYVVRMYVHNNAASNLNLTAKDVKAYVVLPTTTGTEITVSGKITSSNADPVSVWDETTFKSKNGEKFNLAYVDGTAKYYNNAGTFKLGTSVFTNSGQLLGYSKMDGNIPGCIQYSGYLTFHVKAQFAAKPALEIQKEVKLLGTDTWSEQIKAKAGDTVRYRIQVKNTGNTQLQNVHVFDVLPKGLTYVKGSTTVANATNPKGIAVSDNIVTDNGINIGTYGAGANAWIYFNATVDKSVSEECGNTILRNIAQTSAGSSTGTKEDTADVIVDGKTCKDGFTIDKKVKDANGNYVESTTLKAGETAHYRIEFKNTGDNELKNVVLKDTLPSKMTYVKGSTKIGSTAAGDGIVSGEGLNIGNVAAGKSVYIYFDAKVNAGVGEDCADATLTNIVEGKYNNDDKTSKTDTAVVKVDGKECKDGFIINKMVQAEGGKEWSENVTVKAGDKVRYRIQFKNTGETTLKNVVIRDLLPSNMTYVKGSTILYNSANTNGKTLADGIVSTEGINIGDYAKGTEATIYFYATVNASLKDNCNDSILTNTVKGKYNNDSKTEKSDTADVTVPGKDCKEPTPTPYLPETGAGEIISGVLGLAAVSTAAGYYIISRKK